MCGIIAVFNHNPTTCLDQTLKGFDKLNNRRPDCSSIITNEKEFIGFKRLSINDLTTLGSQPMIEGDVAMVCNGEIYNHLAISNNHELHCLSRSDCEVILRLYIKLGIKETIKNLYGVFAFIIRDGDMVYAVRDRIGVRPLFSGITKDNNFAFASEAKALISYCSNIKQVPPASIFTLKISTNETTLEKYYNLPNTIGSSFFNDMLKEKLINAVETRLITDRPVGCLLSGGLDSSVIAAILNKYLPGKFNTYSIGMEGSEDLRCARIVADYLKTNHTEVIFTAKEGFDIIPSVIFALESFDITTIRASVGMYLLAKYISQNTQDKVIFSGEGSDELLCGYLYFHSAPSSEELSAESLRLVNNLYLYDILRGDRCVSSNGLELRVPFLDQQFAEYCLEIPGDIRKPQAGIEKFILRASFEDWLPKEIAWRTKDGFSDSVSGPKKKWFEQIQEFVEKLISDSEYKPFSSKFPTKESYYYWKIYNGFFPGFSNPIPEYWMPKWVDSKDPSGRVLKVYKDLSK